LSQINIHKLLRRRNDSSVLGLMYAPKVASACRSGAARHRSAWSLGKTPFVVWSIKPISAVRSAVQKVYSPKSLHTKGDACVRIDPPFLDRQAIAWCLYLDESGFTEAAAVLGWLSPG
jgi:hypothetical protein